MGIIQSVKLSAMRTAYNYIEKEPEKNALKLMDWVDRFAGDGPNSFKPQRQAVRNVLENPDSEMYKMVMKVFHDIDRDVLKATFEHFF